METEKSCKIGFAITGSFCTHEKIKGIIREMTKWASYRFFQKTYRP